jgi:hypothetical protein
MGDETLQLRTGKPDPMAQAGANLGSRGGRLAHSFFARFLVSIVPATTTSETREDM